MFPGPIDEINWEDFHAQPPLNTIHHYVQAFTVPDYKAWVIQFVCHLFEVQVGILRQRKKTQVLCLFVSETDSVYVSCTKI